MTVQELTKGATMFIDTHCHLNMMVKQEPDVLLTELQFTAINDIVQSALRVGVEKIVNVGTSLPESINSVEIAKRFLPVYATVGIHPCDCNELSGKDFKEMLSSLKNMVKHREENKIVAIGETGLDFYHKPFKKEMQVDCFKAQIELALEYDLPLVVHVREAADEVLRVIDEYRQNKVRGVIHCFLQQKDFAQTVIDWGFCVGLDGPITYPKNDWLREVFKQIPLGSIILETDSPFLPPQEFRGKPNSPVNIPLIAQALADSKEIELEVVEVTTSENAQRLFSI